jgi:hypothetical protein
MRGAAELEREAAEGALRLRTLPCTHTLFLTGLSATDARAMTHALLASKTAERYLDTIDRHRGAGFPRRPLPHHRTSGSASGGSES